MLRVFKIILIFSIFFLFFAGFFHQINAFTQDLGRHLKMGEIIIKSQQIPKTNLFSYTYPNFPFINHHWLSEVIFYLVFQMSSANGLLIFMTLTAVSAFSLLYFSALKKDNIFPITIASLLYFGVLFERTDLRPEIFSFLFLSIFIVILYKYRERFTKWIFLLPLIEIIWVNMHIYFFIGVIILGFFLLDLMVKNKANINCRQVKLLVIIFALTLATTLINPNGLNGAFYPLKVFDNYGYAIEENQNIHFLWNYSQKTTILFFIASVFLLFTSLILTVKKTKFVDWLLCIFFTIFAISMIRNFPLFVFATFIPFVFGLSLIFENLEKKLKKKNQDYLFLIKNIDFLIVFILIIWQTVQITNIKKIGFGLTAGAGKGADFFLKNNLKGPIFNNFDIGSYLDYRLYPKEKVFVDGRPEAYPTSFFKEIYIPLQEDRKTFDLFAQKYNFNVIFLGYVDQTPWAQNFVNQIVNNKNWQLIYLDDYVIILVRNDFNNKSLINEFAINQNSQEINIQSNDLISLFRLAYFYKIAKWQEKEIEIYEKMLSIKPDFCPALYNLILLKQNQDYPLLSIYTARYNKSCK